MKVNILLENHIPKVKRKELTYLNTSILSLETVRKKKKITVLLFHSHIFPFGKIMYKKRKKVKVLGIKGKRLHTRQSDELMPPKGATTQWLVLSC